ncbi:heme A synthase [Qingshengfaniella alkalisoli]|uniref:Heme A synthase n=1 Tax=Qingshengfaniella alkalisoli TaxID=2599296 RepID=A0A5B8I690_9RHOB|nr:heme A synthase [Qingshengfaniella alkalisoli]QDY68955.1 heme A synthase [Qingshengfaniella alkalisoli]
MSQKPRSIFEEVGEGDTPGRAAPTPGLIDRGRSGARRGIRIWLGIMFVLVVLMIAIGGLTRLTDSGLSITEWKPVTGAIPPMNDTAWQSEFEKYQQIPQFELMNPDMTVEGFKAIYWWEWGHRQLGRLIGVVWAFGFFGFMAARQIPPGWAKRLLVPGLLGGVQGAIGWWMVSSGLGNDMTSVASYRLAVHLGLAFVILGVLAWYMMLLARPEKDLFAARRLRNDKQWGMSTGVLHLAMVQILLGALVAGIDAGRSFTDWPLMAGEVFPSSAFAIDPLWRNFFENPALVQFIHRCVGYLLLIFGLVTWNRGRKSSNGHTRMAFNWMAVLLFGQVVLGIGTVLYAAPVHIAILHQLGAVILWVAILRARFFSRYPMPQSVRG